jgi:3-dehydroquinate synthase
MCEFYATFWEEGLKTAAKGKTNVFILADSNLPEAYLEEVVEVLSPQIEVNTFVLEGGEGIKTLEHAQVIYNELDNMGADRKTLFVCLGGGTVSDLGGFAASTFKRGITLVILPTTVLAIVDAAIGGKN